MTALPLLDQDSKEPLLNNSTEQHTDNLTAESSQPSQTDLTPAEEKPNNAIRIPFPDGRFISIASIVGGFFVAIALAVGHHTVLRYLHGRNIDEYPQVWIKGANNGFSNIFSIFVALSADSALTQIKWKASSTEPLRMYNIDNLFALPGPLGLLKTLMRPRGSLWFPIISSLLIQALVLVSILAPSALTVAPSEQASRDIEVPVFNLTSQSLFTTGMYIPNDDSGDVIETAHLTKIGEERINSVLLNLPAFTWTIPKDCGFKCAFNFQYNAPGLECHDIIPDVSPDLGIIYQAETNMYSQNVTESPHPIDVDAPYDLSINYTDITEAFLHNSTHSLTAGTYCRFYQATYKASFEFNSNSSTQRASTSIISHGDYLSWRSTTNATTSLNELREKAASWGNCYAFSLVFRGNASMGLHPGITQTQPILASIFSIDEAAGSFELAVSNLSQTLVDLFSNLTLSLLSTRGGQDSVLATATIWDGSSVWIFTSWILWAVYLPAVVLAITVASYGLYTIHESGIAMDDKFSSFLLATQNAELSERCRNAANFEELQRLQLVHGKNGTFVVVDSGVNSAN